MPRRRSTMPPRLVLRRAGTSRTSGSWSEDDYDVFDDGVVVGRIYKMDGAVGLWWWGVGFGLTGRKSYGTAETFDAAMAAFGVEYQRLLRER